MPNSGLTNAERFWRNVRNGGADECWPWKLAPLRHGYGTFTTKQPREYFRPSRFAWTTKNGPIPEGLNVLHSCDNPPCCNPNHLFLGTQLDNVKDMTAKGRRVDHMGEAHGRAKLTNAEVTEIRRRARAGETVVSLASAFGMGTSTISAIKNGSAWRHLQCQ